MNIPIKPKRWTKEEDMLLQNAVELHGGRHWKLIARACPGRDESQCLQRWSKTLKPGIVKGRWTKWEDAALTRMHEEIGPNWGRIATQIEGRTSKQCRQRWCFQLDPSLKHGQFDAEEDTILLAQYRRLGPKWSQIAQSIIGRTADAVKVRFKSLERRKQKQLKNKHSVGSKRPLQDTSTGTNVLLALTYPAKEQKLKLEAQHDQGSKSQKYAQDRLEQAQASQCSTLRALVQGLVAVGNIQYMGLRKAVCSYLGRSLQQSEKELLSTVLREHDREQQREQHRLQQEQEFSEALRSVLGRFGTCGVGGLSEIVPDMVILDGDSSGAMVGMDLGVGAATEAAAYTDSGNDAEGDGSTDALLRSFCRADSIASLFERCGSLCSLRESDIQGDSDGNCDCRMSLGLGSLRESDLDSMTALLERLSTANAA